MFRMEALKKKLLVGAVVAAIAIIGLVVFAIFGNGAKNKDNMDNKNSGPSAQSVSSGSDDTTGLVVEDIKVGNGREVKTGDMVSVNYVGKLANGTKFDSSYDRKVPFDFKVGAEGIIKGWNKGIIGMKAGGKRKLTIPPALGYDAQGAGKVIPPNATLTFEVELISVK